jgi:hemolysin activation/secretion protein
LLGESFSFSPGVDDGQTKVTALRVAQEYTFRGTEDAISARSTFSFGLNALGATNNASEPDGQFTSWLGQAFWALRFDDRGDSIVLRSEAQLTADNLLPIEKYELGGADTVRGYRENFLVSDQGVFASMEGRIPIFQFTVPATDFDHGISFGPEDGVVTFAPFFDYGFADDHMAKSDAIYSIGAGLLFDLGSFLHAQIYYGKRLTSAKTVDNDSLQDDGIQFRIVLSY